MTESPIVNEWMEQVRTETQRRTLREVLLTVLQARFPHTVSAEVAETIKAQSSSERLTDWIEQAASAPTRAMPPKAESWRPI